MNLHENFAIIILAAGSSSRMGRPKQLIVIGGESLIVRAVKTAIDASPAKVVIVLGANEAADRHAISEYEVTVVVNKQWQTGMGSSLKTAIAFVAQTHPEIIGAVVMLCDQPLITSAHIRQLVERSRKTGKPVVASWYQNSPGVPAYFHRSFFPNLLSIADDTGGKKIFYAYTDMLETIPFAGAAIDIDTEQDLGTFLDGK